MSNNTILFLIGFFTLNIVCLIVGFYAIPAISAFSLFLVIYMLISEYFMDVISNSPITKAIISPIAKTIKTLASSLWRSVLLVLSKSGLYDPKPITVNYDLLNRIENAYEEKKQERIYEKERAREIYQERKARYDKIKLHEKESNYMLMLLLESEELMIRLLRQGIALDVIIEGVGKILSSAPELFRYSGYQSLINFANSTKDKAISISRNHDNIIKMWGNFYNYVEFTDNLLGIERIHTYLDDFPPDCIPEPTEEYFEEQERIGNRYYNGAGKLIPEVIFINRLINGKYARQDYRGVIYVLENESMPGIYKVGKSDRSASDRARELSGTTGVPTKFVVAYEMYCSNIDVVEKLIHDFLADHRVNQNREFFKLPLQDIINAIDDIVHKHNQTNTA